MSRASGDLAGRLREAVVRPFRTARASFWFAGLLVVIWLAVEACGGPEAVSWLYRDFGLTRSGFFGGGVWQLVTHALLHGGWIHLGLNLLMLVMIGGRVEWILGSRAAMVVLVVGIVMGGLFHLALVPPAPAEGILVGVSGGVVAWLLLLTTISPGSRMWPLPVSGRSLGLGLLIASGLLALSNPALGVPGFSMLGRMAESAQAWSLLSIGHACHLGGGVAGLLAGRWILRPRVTKDDLERARARREARGREEERGSL